MSLGALDFLSPVLQRGEYKRAKVRLEMTLTESHDLYVAQTAPTLTTGNKWAPSAATHQAKSALKHQDIVGQVQGTSANGTVKTLHSPYVHLLQI